MNQLLDPTLRRPLLVVGIGLLLVVGMVPTFGSSYALSFGFQFLIWITLALSWSMFSGNSGYASFAHGVFFGVGTYAAAAVLRYTELPFGAALMVAGLSAGVLALAVGLAVFSSPRFAGDLFGLVTLAMAFVVTTIVANTAFLDGGTGVFVREHTENTWIGSSNRNLFIIAALLAGLSAVFAIATSSTRWGIALRSIRDDEAVAESLGVPTYRYKVVTFAVTATIAGLAGAPQAVFLGYVEIGAVFDLYISLFVIIMSILGGMARWWGPLIGAALVVILQEAVLGLGYPDLAQVIVGLILVAVIALMPRGISGLATRLVTRRLVKGGTR